MCNSCLHELVANFNQKPKPPGVHLNYGESLIECPQCRQCHKIKINEVPTCRLMLNFVEAFKAQSNNSQSQQNNQIDDRYHSIIRNNTNENNAYRVPPPPARPPVPPPPQPPQQHQRSTYAPSS